MSLGSLNFIDILSFTSEDGNLYDLVFVQGLSGYGESEPKLIRYSKQSNEVDLSQSLTQEQIDFFINEKIF